jgi:tRNA A37 threonylcarbamoyladenosine biosynthesis protein TsaE
MIKGIAAGLGVADVVKSPSFVIVTEYRVRTGIHHQDTKTQRALDGVGNRQGRQERQGSDEESHHQDTKTQGAPDGVGNRQVRQERQGSDEESHHQDTKAQGGTDLPVYHIDLYRLGASGDRREANGEQPAAGDEFEGIGLDSYLEGDGVCLIEWAERAETALPDTAIRVRMSVDGSGRRIEIAGLRAALQPGQ